MISTILTALVLAACVAIVLEPIYRHYRWSCWLVLVLFFLLHRFFGLATIRFLKKQHMGSILQDLGVQLENSLYGLLLSLAPYARWFSVEWNPDHIKNRILNYLHELASWNPSYLLEGIRFLFSSFVGMGVFLLACIVFVVRGRIYLERLHRLSGLANVHWQALSSLIQISVRAALLSSIASAGAQSLCAYLLLKLTHTPHALLLFPFAFIGTFFPMVGTAPVLLFASLYHLLQHHFIATCVLLLAAPSIGLIDNVVRPLVQKQYTAMHPLLVILSSMGGILQLGVSGIFLGPLLAALAQWSLTQLTRAHLTQKEKGGA